MLRSIKEKLRAKRMQSSAVAEAQHWKTDPRLRACLEALRGSCTVAPMDLHEALAAVVSIAMAENTWTQAEQLPPAFLPQTVFLLWSEPLFPVLKTDRDLALQSLGALTDAAGEVFLIGEQMDRVARLNREGRILLYAV